MKNRIAVRCLPISLTVVLATVVIASAHHSYADFDREISVVIEGEIQHVEWANPHVLLTIRTEAAETYRVEWRAVSQLSRWRVSPGELNSGDHVVVTGSIHRDPDVRVMTLLREIHRPADDWRWNLGIN